MKVYHGSAFQLDGGVLQPRQANTYEGSGVPESELRNAIYTTPSLEYAIAMAVRPPGRTEIDTVNHKITFDNPQEFNPEKDIYIYEFDLDNIPKDSIEQVDELQIALHLTKGLKPEGVMNFKAKEVMNYYELTNYKKESDAELKAEINETEPESNWSSGVNLR